ncbi:hypothetical protein L228DRAFT_250483 [Xylona heveae TC161]|uniref:RRM domain-containing protein n=1 Tax=Xylona heveae (strain CBS 132557 / TC161) TaxID=1328760 RepID=A0A165A780_XYLHT|nr:hypothetical protein L228DRAFT_250483 [Xylona heveae TC161]KZF20053.1 hypothetical protein L228DRAFT_250483 [Xylona heveae TC161]
MRVWSGNASTILAAERRRAAGTIHTSPAASENLQRPVLKNIAVHGSQEPVPVTFQNTDTVPEHQNCSLWLTGIPASANIRDLLSEVQGGKVVESKLYSAKGSFQGTRAAKITFSTPAGASRMLSFAIRNGFQVLGQRVIVTRNRNRRAPNELAVVHGHSRVLLVRGSPSQTHPNCILKLFAGNLRFQIDQMLHSFRRVPEEAELEIRFAYLQQATAAKSLLESNPDLGVTCCFGFDPCCKPWQLGG